MNNKNALDLCAICLGVALFAFDKMARLGRFFPGVSLVGTSPDKTRSPDLRAPSPGGFAATVASWLGRTSSVAANGEVLPCKIYSACKLPFDEDCQDPTNGVRVRQK